MKSLLKDLAIFVLICYSILTCIPIYNLTMEFINQTFTISDIATFIILEALIWFGYRVLVHFYHYLLKVWFD